MRFDSQCLPGTEASKGSEAPRAAPDNVRPVPRWMWVAVGVLLIASFLRSQRSNDDVRFWSYVTSCAHAGDWDGIYDKQENAFAFHPYGNLSMVVLLYPLGYLSQGAMRLVVALVIIGTWFLMHRLMVEGVADRRWGFRGWVPMAVGGPLLGMILAGRYLLNDLGLKQLNMITFTCGCVGMFWMLACHPPLRRSAGAVLLAFSIGLKLMTLPLLAMLLIKRAWRPAALVAVLSFAFLWLLPHVVLGPATHARLSSLVEGNTLNMWLQIEDTTQTWSYLNFVHYRMYIAPLWSGLADVPPETYQLICLAATCLIGLPALQVMLQSPWSRMNATRLWEELALVGLAWALIDPDGRTAHFVTLIPAFGYVIYRRLELWHEAGRAPRAWQWALYLFVAATTLWMVRLKDPVAHHYYMHYGLFSFGTFTLYGIAWQEIRSARGRTAALLTGTAEDPTPASPATRLAPAA